MAKQTKRARKFVTSGGVKGRLEKGTITNKGKLKRKQRPGKGSDDGPKKQPRPDSYNDAVQQKRTDEDFVSKKNLGDLDMESFFATFAEGVDEDLNEEAQGDEEGNSDSEGDKVADADDSDDEDAPEIGDDKSDSESEEDDEVPAKKNKKSEKLSKKAKVSDSDSDSDDEDIEAAERRMKEGMGRLRKEDPEFHEFLKENEQSLLDYGEDDDLDRTNHEKTDVAADDQPESGNFIVLTPEGLKKLEHGAFKSHGVKTLKKIVNAYTSACHMADATPDSNEKGKKYNIESSVVFDRLMVTALNRCQEEFHYHLLGKGSTEKAPLPKKKDITDASQDDSEDVAMKLEDMDETKPINPKLLENSRRWADVKPILFTFLKATMHVLSEAKEPDLVTFILKALSKYVPYMTPFPRVAESMMKILTTLWSAPIDSSEDYQVVRLHSFLRIRQLALTQPFPFIEECLKKLYLAYAQRAKFATGSSVTSALPTLTFMGNCVVELYSLDYHSSYQHAFVYIRQLALHLRTAMQKKTAEAFGTVYCWQFLHCLKLWVAVLTEACQSRENDTPGEDQLLRSLLFPLSQTIIGTVRLIPSTRYLPLRLFCVRLLQQLAAAAEVFLPTTSILLEALDLRELSQPPKRSMKEGTQQLALIFRLKAEDPLRTMEELEMCVSEIFVLLNREVDLYQYSAGFPEFSVRICQRLRKFVKETRQSRWKAYAKGSLDLCDRHSKKAMTERAKLTDVAPKDVKQLEVLKPVNTPSMGERFKQALEKEKRLEAASRPVQKQANKKPEDDETNEEGSPEKKSSKKKKKKAAAPRAKENANALEQADEIEEGVNWSDDDE